MPPPAARQSKRFAANVAAEPADAVHHRQRIGEVLVRAGRVNRCFLRDQVVPGAAIVLVAHASGTPNSGTHSKNPIPGTDYTLRCGMAAHRQIDGVYQWELSIPPASAAALLSAVCVNLDDPNSHYVGHLLLGPKTWQIRFSGNEFELQPLGHGSLRRSFDTIFGLPQGRIVATKAGCRVELRRGENRIERLAIMAIAVVLPAIIGPIVASQFLSDFSIWTRATVATAIVAWFATWCLWLIPWIARLRYRDMLDELFADYILPVQAYKKAVAPAYHAVPPSHGK